ncbi:CD209 antigen-like protein C [Chiloscyllium punctatum]|uniref:CD209 antigen-like protein C n=1 Tax=Chiloscyllium punctatum TaxID=137246 RepID=UPI003B63C4C9
MSSRMTGGNKYDDFQHFELDSDQKQWQSHQSAGNPFKSISFGKVLMFLIFILLGVILIVLIIGGVKWSEVNRRVEEFPSQNQIQISQALENVLEKSDLKDIMLQFQDEVTRMEDRVLAAFSNKMTNFMSKISMKIEMLPEPACQNLQCPRYWVNFNDSCYYFSTQEASWNSSKTYCSLRHSYLVSINTAEEQHFLQVESNSKSYWIGLHDFETEDNWHWEDGTDYKTSPKFWDEGEPNNVDDEDCAHINHKTLWNDNRCSVKLSFICEKNSKPNKIPDQLD